MINGIFSANLPYYTEDVHEVLIPINDSLTVIVRFPIEIPYTRIEMPISLQYLPSDKHPDCHTVKVKARIKKTGKGRDHDRNRIKYLKRIGMINIEG